MEYTQADVSSRQRAFSALMHNGWMENQHTLYSLFIRST